MLYITDNFISVRRDIDETIHFETHSVSTMEPHIPSSHAEEPHTAVGVHSGVEGEGEPHHEKRSGLRKLKDKAKKIKEAVLTKYGHGNEHDEEKEEMVDDPEDHGAPVSESAAVGRQEVDSGMPKGNLKRPSVTAEDHYESEITDAPVKPFGERQEEKLGQSKVNLEEGHVDYPANVGQEENLGQSKVRIGEQTDMEENPHAPKDRSQAFDTSNYQTKVADPTDTGGEDAGINPIVSSFNKMSVQDELELESKPKQGLEQKLSTGSHDQFSSEPIPSNTTTTNPENPECVPKSFDASKPEDMQHDKLTGVISPDTYIIEQGGEDAGINPIVSSFNKMSVHDELELEPKPKQGLEQKLSTGSHDQFSSEPIPSNTTTTNLENPECVPKSFDTSKPEDMQRDKSTGVISPDTYFMEQVSELPAVRSGVDAQEVDSGRPSDNLERPLMTAEDRYESEIADPPIRPFGERQEVKSGQNRANLEEGHVDYPTNVGQEENLGQSKAIIGEQTDMEENPHAPKDRSQAFDPSNYQTKVADATGTVSESAAVRSGVGSGMPRDNLERPSVTTEDRYDSEITDLPVSPFGERQEKSRANLGRPTAMEEGHVDHPAANVGREENLGQTEVGIGEQTGMEENPHSSKDPSQAFSPSTGTDGEEDGINPIVTSFDKMNVYDGSEPEREPKSGLEQKLSTGSHDQFSAEPIPISTTNPENSESVPKSFDASEPEDMPSDKLTGVISSDTSAIADKAASAKEVDASKPGDTGGENEDAGGGNATKSSASPTEHTPKIAPTLMEKVAGAGSTVMSKVYGGGTGQEGEDKKGPDKDASVKENVGEKFWPSEEDQVPSELISGAISKPKEGVEKTEQEKTEGDGPVSEVVSDALHKRNDDPENEGGTKAVAKATQSEEVEKPLGTGTEDAMEDGDATKVGTETGTVGWLRGTVNSWLGRGGESPTSQGTATSGEGHDEDVLAETRHEGEGK